MAAPDPTLEAILADAGADTASAINTDVELLTHAWCNEKAAPEILPFATRLVGGLREMLKSQEEAVGRLDTSAVHAVIALGYQMDIQRMRYLITAYLRTRLLKIQRWAAHISADVDVLARLSPEERSFARGFVAARMSHLQASVLLLLPATYRPLVGVEPAVLDGPPLDTHVTALPLEPLGDVLLGDEPMDMPAGLAKILSYRHVRDHVAAGRVRLV